MQTENLQAFYEEPWDGRYDLIPKHAKEGFDTIFDGIDVTRTTVKLEVISDKGYTVVPTIRLNGKTMVWPATRPSPPGGGYDRVIDPDHDGTLPPVSCWRARF